MSRRSIGGPLPQRTPDPAYPEYTEIVAEARRTSPRYVMQTDLDRWMAVASRRGQNWCTAVLGFAYPGLRSMSTLECQTLTIADQRDLSPPLPQAILDAQEQADAHQRASQERNTALAVLDRQRWDAALGACSVPVTVRANTRGGGRTNHRGGGALDHVVPTEHAVSGTSRTHPAGRALCETVGRAKPLELADTPTDGPATCRRCLEWMPKVRPLEDGRTWWGVGGNSTTEHYYEAPTARGAIAKFRADLIEQDLGGPWSLTDARRRAAAEDLRVVEGPLSTSQAFALELGWAWAERIATERSSDAVPSNATNPIDRETALRWLTEENVARIEGNMRARYYPAGAGQP